VLLVGNESQVIVLEAVPGANKPPQTIIREAALNVNETGQNITRANLFIQPVVMESSSSTQYWSIRYRTRRRLHPRKSFVIKLGEG